VPGPVLSSSQNLTHVNLKREEGIIVLFFYIAKAAEAQKG
jgi:hypothetical protein